VSTNFTTTAFVIYCAGSQGENLRNTSIRQALEFTLKSTVFWG
jgi:hypothetical protein